MPMLNKVNLKDALARAEQANYQQVMDQINDVNSFSQSAIAKPYKSLADENNQILKEVALIQNEAAQASAERSMQFEHDEAELYRNWLETQSNTAYQRAVADMKKAGLTPALAYQQSGASTPSGAMASGSAASMSMADVDTESVVTLLKTYLDNNSAESIAVSKNKTAILNKIIGLFG